MRFQHGLKHTYNMTKINTTLFDLDTIYTRLTHARTWELTVELKEIKNELEDHKNKLISTGFMSGQNLEEIIATDQQLYFLKRNIVTLETALLAHESYMFERIVKLGVVYCLN